VSAAPLRLFEGYGVELEYAIVERGTLAVLPVADQVLRAAVGAIASDYEDGPVAWSNELVLHVIELKTNGPTPSLAGWAERFLAEVRRIDGILAPLGGRLMPTGMHPTMVPERDTELWPHDASEVYAAYDRIFGCRGHGWSNLQSCHLNLPFSGDDEFGRLHAAIRAVLPLLPALAASSPFVEGRASGFLDSRLEAYERNQARIPSIAGMIVPEPVFTEADYRREILARAYADIAPFDPGGLLRHEFLNSRGAIARFERDAIEIRLLDTQETPAADLAIASLVSAVLRALVAERWVPLAALQALETAPLAAVLDATIRDGDAALVTHGPLVAALGAGPAPRRAGDLWARLAAAVRDDAALEPALATALDVILAEGPLARRVLRAAGGAPAPARLVEVYASLCDCLVAGRSFRP